MGSFNPIAPAVARAIMDAAGVAPATVADLAKAGLVKSYSKLLEIQDASGRHEKRDSRMPPDLWRRIIEHGMIDDVFAMGTVRIPGRTSPSPQPKVEAIGIRFDEKSIRDACANHGAVGPSAVAVQALPPAPVVESVMPAVITTAPVDGSPDAAPVQAVKKKSPIPEGAYQLTIPQAASAMGIGPTSVYKLIKQGKLVKNQTLGRSHVTVASIQALIGQPQ